MRRMSVGLALGRRAACTLARSATVRLAFCSAIVLPAFCSTTAWAAEQPTPGPWKATADVGLNVTQSSYSNSWKGGEEGSVSWTIVANLLAERQYTPTINWRNTLKLTFGQLMRQQVVEEFNTVEKKWSKPEKSTDRVFFESLFRLTFGWAVDPYAAGTFESQFYDISHPVVERFVNPIQLTESAGVGRTFVKNDAIEFYSRLGAALREDIDRQVEPADVILPENEYHTKTKSTLDGGAEWVTDFRRTFGENLNYVTKLRVFQAFFFSEADELEGTRQEDYWKAPDVAWENTISASVSKYVQTSLFFELLYDKEIDRRGRFREILALGVTYKLF